MSAAGYRHDLGDIGRALYGVWFHATRAAWLHCDLRWGDTGRPVPHAAAHESDWRCHGARDLAGRRYRVFDFWAFIGRHDDWRAHRRYGGGSARLRYPRYGLREDASLAAFYLISARTWRAYCFNPWQQCGFDECAVRHGTGAQRCDIDPALLDCEPLGSGAGGGVSAACPGMRRSTLLRSVSGLSAIMHLTFLALVVLNLVSGFHALGTLMAVGIMILPAAAAEVLANIGGLLAAAVITAILSSFCGLLLSYHFSLPSGPAIILVAGIAYVLSIVVGPVGGLVARIQPQPSNES